MEKQPVNKTQNSGLRKYSGPITEKISLGLMKVIPDITANDITMTGLLTVVAGAALTIIPESLLGFDFTPLAIALMTGGSSLDVLDGAMARIQKTAGVDGALLDLKADRWQETGLVLARITTASMRKDPLGVAAAAMAGITNPLPSWLRAQVEEVDSVVPESGAKPIGFLGTRAMRAVFGIGATGFSEISFPGTEQSIQPMLDLITAFSNIYTTFERAGILQKAKKKELAINSDPKIKELGALKVKELKKFVALNTGIMLAAGTIGMINALNQ